MSNRLEIKLPDGFSYENGFIKQISPYRIVYDEEYKSKQSTNDKMSFLRLGFISSHIKYEEMKSMSMVDIGSGNGNFASCCRGVFAEVKEYDVVGDNVISKEELYGNNWGLVVLSDVLEHFDNINDIFLIKWKYCFLSFPETPDVKSFEELSKWRHFKPGEHIYNLYRKGVEKWINSIEPDIKVISHSNFEDIIRKRWDENIPNISSMLIKRMNYN